MTPRLHKIAVQMMFKFEVIIITQEPSKKQVGFSDGT
jgi:hypothetical protein